MSGEGRDATGETVMGMRVAAWMWETPSPEPTVIHSPLTHFATHWSTGPDSAERLFRETDVRELIAAAPDTRDALSIAFACLRGDCGAAFRDLHPATWRKMEAALAKAEGREPSKEGA